MGKLNDIIYSISNDPDVIDENPDLGLINPEEAQKQIKDLFLEIIGNSDLAIEGMPGQTNDNMARNGLRQELRAKVNEL